MMQEVLKFENLYLSDTHRLRSAGINLDNQKGLTHLRNSIRQLLDLCSHRVWLFSDHPADMTPELAKTKLLGAIGIQVIDPEARRAVLHLYTNQSEFKPGHLSAILSKIFLELDIYRLELSVPAENTDWLTTLQQVNFREEGRLRNCLVNSVTKRHQDVLMYSILRPDFKLFGTAFIPFNKGVFAVSGGCEYLTLADFVRFGESFNSSMQQESAEILGLLNPQGVLDSRNKLMDSLAGRRYWAKHEVPEPVLAAAEQAADYFSGKLTHFNLPLDLKQGSPFQQRVWQELSKIPYASTCTYEELAYHLTPHDWSLARKMARAVGSACGANPLPLILPCHRVIGKDGRLVGFSGGLDIKEYLLDHEIMGINE